MTNKRLKSKEIGFQESLFSDPGHPLRFVPSLNQGFQFHSFSKLRPGFIEIGTLDNKTLDKMLFTSDQWNQDSAFFRQDLLSAPMKIRRLIVAVKLFSLFRSARLTAGLAIVLFTLVAPGVAGAMNLSIAFVVDASGSMKGEKLQAAKDAVRAAVNAITAKGKLKQQGIEICLFSFSGCGNCTRRVPITQDGNRILSGLNFGASGGTPLAFSLDKAADYLFREGVGKQGKIILLSDGGESCKGNPGQAAAGINRTEKTVPMFPKNWHLSNSPNADGRMSVIKEAIRYLRRRGQDLKTTDPKLSALLTRYAEEIWKAPLYYEKKNWAARIQNKNPSAGTSWLGNITLYGQFMSYNAFGVLDKNRTDADLGEVASTLIHEIRHRLGGWEYAAYSIQWQTFKSLKVPLTSNLAINAKGWFKKNGYELTPGGTWRATTRTRKIIDWVTD